MKSKECNHLKGVCCMKKLVLLCVMLGLAVSLSQAAELSRNWNPSANPANDPNAPFAYWTDAANWAGGAVPEGGPNNELGDPDFYKVQFFVSGAKDCYLDSKKTVGHLVAGDGGVNPGILHLLPGAELYAGYKPDGSKAWTGCGFGGQGGGIYVHEDALLDTYDHLWIAHGDNSSGGLTIDGGTVVVNQMFGINFDGKTTASGYCDVKDGLLHLMNYNNNQSIRGTAANANMNIDKGTVIIRYWRLDQVNACDPAVCAQDGRLTGFKNANFDKKINVEGGDVNNAQNDIINNVKFTWDAANNQTIITAVHPMQPVPYLDEVLPVGEMPFAWNNWDPNEAGDSVLVDIWLGTDPNKTNGAYTKVVSAMDVTGEASSSVLINVPTAGTYYWQVDTYNGADEMKEGDVFSFQATDNLPPVVDAGNGFISWVGDTIQLDATVTDENTPTVTWSATDPSVTFVDSSVLDAQVSASAVGTYTLTLSVDDGFNAPVTATTIIQVEADSCAAAHAAGSDYVGDIVDDCVINLDDFAVMALDWLTDYNLTDEVVR